MMLSALKNKMLEEISASFTRQELLWAHGYVSGALAAKGEFLPSPFYSSDNSGESVLSGLSEEPETYTGTVLSKVNLNDTGSNKTTYHLEILAEEINYEPGDMLSIVDENDYDDEKSVRYPIASSPEANNGEIHLLLPGDILKTNTGDSIGFRIHKNKGLRLPDENKNMIMIGPGCGIAPFRSFLAHRDATGASGLNWLFFEEEYFITDFLYQTELQNWVETGVLTRLNVAFSGEQEAMLVQHKMQQHGHDIAEWLQEGASLFICATDKETIEDINNSLLNIFTVHLKKSGNEASRYLDELKKAGRYRSERLKYKKTIAAPVAMSPVV